MEKIVYQNGKTEISDDYTQLFYTNLALRPSCGECPFSNMKRGSDFTVGDYWGVHKYFPDFDDNTGVSLLFLNNERVLKLFDSFKDELEIIEITEKQACQQRNLSKPTIIPKVNKWFWRDYRKKGLEFCLKHWSPNGGLNFKLKRKILRLLNLWE